MHVSPAPDSLLHMLEIRALSVDDLSTARYVVDTAFARGAKDYYSAADYRALETSATLNAVSFFERLGYLETRRGTWGLPSGREMPMAFMRKIGDGRDDILH